MGFQPIQGDYFEKPTGLTAEDLLKWDGSALTRVAVGATGQGLTVGVHGLHYSDISRGLQTIIYGVPFENKQITYEFTEVSKTFENSVGNYRCYNITNIPLTSSIDNFFEAPFNYKLSHKIYSANAGLPYFKIYGYYTSDTVEMSGGFNYGLSEGELAIDNATNKKMIGLYGPTYYPKDTPGWYSVVANNDTYINNSISIPYGENLGIHATRANSGSNSFYISKINARFSKELPSTFTISSLSNIFSQLHHIILYDNGDSVKLNNDTNYIFTGISGAPTEITGLNSSQDEMINIDDINQVEIVSGNPIFIFEKA